MYMTMTEHPGHLVQDLRPMSMMTDRWVLHCILLQESKGNADLLSPPDDLSCTESFPFQTQLSHNKQCASFTTGLAHLTN